MSKGTYINGKKNGVFDEFYPTGAVKTSTTYRRGKPHGASRLRDKNNYLISYTEYVNGKRNGPAFSYFPKEKPKIWAYRKNDKLHGVVKEFNEKGDLIRVSTYKNGEEIESVKF